MPKVYIVQGNKQISNMFTAYDWDITQNMLEADLVQFTGGSDITPALYNQQKHPRTHSYIGRDQKEKMFFQIAKKKGIPMAGICRGGQFLNVMSGGSMIQDCDGHTISYEHKAVDMISGESLMVTSTHHQMMQPPPENKDVVVFLCASESSRQEVMPSTESLLQSPIKTLDKIFIDIEGVFFKDTKCLCFQPHPEYGHASPELIKYYFGRIEQFLNL